MKSRTIFLNVNDKNRLMDLIEDGIYNNSPDKKYLQELKKELERGKVFEPKEIPNDVITMNSMVRLTYLDSSEEMTLTLVFPDMADNSNDKISILSPIGTALIGYRVGDVIELEVPAGLIRLNVVEILYQPEAEGDFDL